MNIHIMSGSWSWSGSESRCGSENIVGESFGTGENMVFQRISCDDCGAAWTALFPCTGLTITKG